MKIGPSCLFLHRKSCLLNSFAETQNMKYTMMIWKYITPYILRSAIKNDAHDGKTTCNLNAMKSGRPLDFLTCCRNFAITMSYIVSSYIVILVWLIFYFWGWFWKFQYAILENQILRCTYWYAGCQEMNTLKGCTIISHLL